LNLYVDSSGIVAWLLGEERAPAAVEALREARLVLSSRLTLVECDRVLIRCAAEGRLDEAAQAELSAQAASAAAHWMQLAITESILSRARMPFQGGPVRTLDAIHLASALESRAAVASLTVLTLDDRMRRAARALGLDVVPD
jgi:uncharacterized protein